MIWLITTIGFILRLIGSNQSLWLDEAASVEIAKTPLPDFFVKMATDFHPPFFYLLLKPWIFIAQCEMSLRLPFILIGTATIPAIYYLTRRFSSKNHTPLVAALLLAVNPFHIYYSQELRMYSLSALLVTLSWYLILRYKEKITVKQSLLFILVQTLGFYTFYGVLFNWVAQVIFLFLAKSKNKELKSLVLVSPVVLLPWWPILKIQLANGGYLSSALSGWNQLSGDLSLKSLSLLVLKPAFGRLSFSPKPLYFFLASLTSLIYLYLVIKAWSQKHKPLFAWLTIPIIVALIVSIKTPVLGYWRYLYLLPALVILASLGLEKLATKQKTIITLILVLLSAISIVITQLTPQNQRENWRELSKYLSDKQGLVVVNFPSVFSPLKYYLPDGKFLPAQERLKVLSSNFLPAIANSSFQGKDIYYLEYLSDLTDPKRTVLVLINSYFNKAEEISIPGVGKLIHFTPKL